MEVLYNGIETDVYQLRCRKKNNKSVVIGFIGRLTAAKGVDKLLDAFIEIKKAHIDWDLSLRIIGGSAFKGGLENEFTTMLKEKARPYERMVTFTGYIDHKYMAKEIAKCDVVVAPSQCNDALPLSVAEAMACGCLVVATEIGGIPEIQNDKRYLVKPSDNYVDALIQTLEVAVMDIICERFVMQTARERIVEYFNGDNYLKNLVKLLGNFENKH